MDDASGCTSHPIVGRQRSFEVDPARFDHFALGPGETIDEQALALDPTWSLYALDPDRGRALLVQLPPTIDLSARPFAYVAQFDHATRAAVVPMDRLSAMAQSLPRPDRLVHLFSTGRCGSTLASRIFAELDGVWSVSEPDAIAQLVTRRRDYHTPQMQDALRTVAAWSYRPTASDAGRTCVLKYRSEALFHAADYLAATPSSTAIFLYRDLVSWVDSTYRFAQKHGVDVSPGATSAAALVWPIVSARAPEETVGDICDVSDPDTPFEHVLTALWTMRVEAFATAVDAGLPLQAVSYARLNEDRQATVATLLAMLGHDTEENRARAMHGYEEDSQRGTAGARSTTAVPLGAAQRAGIVRLATQHPRVRAAVERIDDVEARRDGATAP